MTVHPPSVRVQQVLHGVALRPLAWGQQLLHALAAAVRVAFCGGHQYSACRSPSAVGMSIQSFCMPSADFPLVWGNKLCVLVPAPSSPSPVLLWVHALGTGDFSNSSFFVF